MSTWQDLVRAALIGTERTAVPAVAVPGVPDSPGAADDPAALLLDRAALLTVARRGGRLPERAEPPPAAEPDAAPAVGAAAGRRLALILSGEHADLLTEWLTAAVARGRRAPAALLPALLERVRRVVPADPELRRLAAAAGGSRARWLAGLNRDWKFVTARTLPGHDAWRLGSTVQRRGYLAALRATDPGAARDLIAGGWAAAAPDERVMFVKALAGGLSLADEPLLEAALDDPNAWVRTMAAEVLAALPGSALARRMAERALGCLSLHQGARGTRLVVIAPAQCDAAMRRDGVGPGPIAGISHPSGQANLVAEVLARTPLRTWTDAFGRPPEQIIALPSGGWASVLLAGWSQAAMAQRDQDWMKTLISQVLTDEPPGTDRWSQTLRQLARRVDPALGAPEVTTSREAGESAAVRDAIRVLRFRYDMLKELDDDDSAG